MTPEELANKWIKELEEAGLTYDQMINVFRLAREKYNNKRAKLVVFEENGKEQKAKLIYEDQKPEFSDYGKVFLRYLNDDLTDKKLDGKKVIGLKHYSMVKVIGYID